MEHRTECDGGGGRCHALAAIVTDLMITLTRERAVDGKVSLEDLEKIAQLMRRGTIALDEALKAHEERCRTSMRKAKGNVGTRSNPFQRLMVRPFESLLHGDPPPIAREYLVNYFQFLEHTLGKRLEQFDRHARGIIQALLVVHGNNLTWDHFYADQRTAKTLSAALKLVTHELQSPDGQRLWHACMVRPVGELPALPASRAHEVMNLLLHTHRGLLTAAD